MSIKIILFERQKKRKRKKPRNRNRSGLQLVVQFIKLSLNSSKKAFFMCSKQGIAKENTDLCDVGAISFSFYFNKTALGACTPVTEADGARGLLGDMATHRRSRGHWWWGCPRRPLPNERPEVNTWAKLWGLSKREAVEKRGGRWCSMHRGSESYRKPTKLAPHHKE